MVNMVMSMVLIAPWADRVSEAETPISGGRKPVAIIENN